MIITTSTSLNDTKIIIRPIQSSDKQNLIKGLDKLSSTSQYNRFLSYKKEFSNDELINLTEIDPETHLALVMGIEKDGQIIGVGVARAVRKSIGSSEAELAITIIDEYQGFGLGKLLLKEILNAAKEIGITKMYGELETTNQKVLNLLKGCHDLSLKYLGQGILSMEFKLQDHED